MWRVFNIFKKQLVTLLFLCLLSTNSSAKKLKIRSCTMPSGEVVLMDKPCPINSKTDSYSKPQKQKKKQATKQATKQFKKQLKKTSNGQGQNIQTKKSNNTPPKVKPNKRQSHSQHDRSQSIPLSTLLASIKAPSNWFIQSFKITGGDVITASSKRLLQPTKMLIGATVHRYTNTQKHFNKDAFSLAIDHFHEIRFDENNLLTESEFIKHKRFKVFNVHYRKKRLRQSTLKVLAQFYVDSQNNDLYVLTIQAPSKHWQRLSKWRQQLLAQVAL